MKLIGTNEGTNNMQITTILAKIKKASAAIKVTKKGLTERKKKIKAIAIAINRAWWPELDVDLSHHSHLLTHTFYLLSLAHTPTPFPCPCFLYHFRQIVFLRSFKFQSHASDTMLPIVLIILVICYISSNVLFQEIWSISVFIISFRCVFIILYLLLVQV